MLITGRKLVREPELMREWKKNKERVTLSEQMKTAAPALASEVKGKEPDPLMMTELTWEM